MLVFLFLLNALTGLASSQTSTGATISSTAPTTVEKWDGLGILAINTITELSRVCIVVSRRDYSLGAGGPYTYIKYPSSYRATLTQATGLVDSAFRTTQSSFSRIQMIMGLMADDVRTVLSVLLEASAQEREVFLPTTLDSIARKAQDSVSAIEAITLALKEVVALFQELLRAIQPSPPSTTTPGSRSSTSTQTAKSPLDIDHATAVSNILAQSNGLIAIWNQLSQRLSKVALQANRATQFLNNRNMLLWTLSDIDQVANLLSILTAVYSNLSIKAITPHSSSMSSYLILQSEEERLATVAKVNLRATNNIPIVQGVFAQAMVDHATHNKKRNEQYQQLAASPST